MKFVKSAILALLSFAWLSPTIAQDAEVRDYPKRAVKIIVPFAAGGPADVYARFMALRLQESMKQPFVVENKPGASAVIGTDAVAKSPADGYTLLLMSNAHTVNETLIANKPYSLTRDFVGIAPINYSDLVLVANPSVPDKSINDLLKSAKANPGKINYASSGNGTPYHMAGELFKNMAGVNLTHVPYKGSAGARTDVIGGQVEYMFDAVSTMVEQIKAGKVRAIATTGLTRSAVLADLPTVAEAGVPNYEATIWLGLMAPKDTPKGIVQKLNEAMSKVVQQGEVKTAWAKQGVTAMQMPPDAFETYIRSDISKWAGVIKSANIKAD